MSEEENRLSVEVPSAEYVKVVSISQAREITSRRDYSIHRVADALVGDETGCVVLTLWDEKIDEFGKGDVLEIINGYTSLFRGFLRLNIGRYGEAGKVDKWVGEVNTKNNLSETMHKTMWTRPTSSPFKRQRRMIN